MTSGPRRQPARTRGRSVGPAGWSTDHPSRPTVQWAPPPPASTWHSLVGSLGSSCKWPAKPQCLPLYMRGGRVQMETQHTHLYPLLLLWSMRAQLLGDLGRLGVSENRERVRRSRGKCRACRHSSPLVPQQILIWL
jgi:hypothetical protein